MSFKQEEMFLFSFHNIHINITSRNMIDVLSNNRALVVQCCLSLSMIGISTHVGDIGGMMTGIDYNVSRPGADKSFAFPFRFGKYVLGDSDGRRYTISRITTFWWITLCMYNAPAQRDAQDVAYIARAGRFRDSRERILSAARNSNLPGKEERL